MEPAVEAVGDSAATLRRANIRDPKDITRLMWFAAMLAVGLLLANAARNTVSGAEADLLALVGQIPRLLLMSLVIFAQLGYLLTVLILPLVLLVTRRWRPAAMLGGAYWLTIAVAALLARVVGSVVPVPVAQFDQAPVIDVAWPPSDAIAAITAVVTTAAPGLSRRWLRAAWGYVLLLAAMRAVSGSDLPLDLLVAVGLGGVVGSSLLLAFGRRSLMTSPAGVRAALERSGLSVTALHELDRGSTMSRSAAADLADGRRLFVKIVGGTHQRADALNRAYRRLRLRDVGENVPMVSVRQVATVESMLSMFAQRHGVRTPSIEALAPLGDEEVLLAFDYLPGATLAEVPAGEVSDEMLADAWRQVSGLRRAGIAHRDLQQSSWMVDGASRVWLIDFSFGESAASAGALASDVAEFLAATYAVVGAQRAVAAALAVIGPEATASALPRLVPAALSRPTRAAVASTEGRTEPLVAEICAATGVQRPQLAAIERIKPRQLVMGAMLAVAIYVLLPQLADFPGMIRAVGQADFGLVALVILASGLTYLGSAMAVSGGAPGTVPVHEAGMVAVAGTFVGAVAPPGIGHTGLNVRFLQRRGFAAPLAVSATAAKEMAVGVVHVVLLAGFAMAAGSAGLISEELAKLPSAMVIAAAAGALLVVVGALAVVPGARRFVRETVVPAVRSSWAAMGQVLASPGKMVLLFGGAAILQVGYILALWLSCLALGAPVDLTAVALVYLTVGSAASLAPTPGGVGAVEAVLTAALTGLGIASSTSLACVFLYRLATFWLPIPAGGLAFRWLGAKELI